MHAFLKSSGKNYLKRRLGMDIALQNFLVRYKELDRNLVLKWTGKLKVIKKKTNKETHTTGTTTTKPGWHLVKW